MTDWEQAKSALPRGCTCAACRDGVLYESNARGVAPLLQWLDEGVDLMGSSAADRVVGKAAAMLYCLLGVRRVYAQIISVGAVKILRAQGIEIGWETLAEHIRNREKTGLCPLEAALLHEEEPERGLDVIRETLRTLREKPHRG